jgi:hypothetical protein
MFDRKKSWYGTHSALLGLMMLLLSLISPAISLADHDFGGYSGDDPYDPAAGGTPELSPATLSAGDAASNVTERSGAAAVEASGDRFARFIDDPAFFAGRSNWRVVASAASERASVRFIDDPGLSAAVEANGDEAVRFLDDPALMYLRESCGC